MTILLDMAKMTIRTTFALDVETAESLKRLADLWGVSKSQALRQAVAAAAIVERADRGSTALGALAQLQKQMGLDHVQAERWVEGIRSERRASRG